LKLISTAAIPTADAPPCGSNFSALMAVEKHRSLEIINTINIKMLLNKGGKVYSNL
jgi:hypothetical protein